MPLSELSRQTGVPVRALQMYLDLELFRAEPVYDERHVHRIALIRTLLDVGGVPYDAVRRILRHMDSSPPSLHEVLETVLYALPVRGTTCREKEEQEEWARARQHTARLAEARNWQVNEENPAWLTLTQVLVACEWLEQCDLLRLLDTYADALERIGEAEVALLRSRPAPDSAAAGMVTSAVLGDVALSALRRLIHEHFSNLAEREEPTQRN
ncbi:MerR family transcriptional regulator [Streptomyces sp. Wb2n-11]|uniref:MerR family transcriptional regulator n=1 Tax=Streptomyces sp. Wb2n-11 TaxID=1030533 RepID=UPI000AD810C8|nr:MerR family transcriptional regulator [Streptomyces sp. Wb2n-11]